MSNAVIVSTARTPLAKSWKGGFNMTHGATLGGHAVRHAIERAGIDGALVEDVIMGCANPEGATGANIARQIALAAGLPVTVSGLTVNRFCSSGLQTIALAAQQIMSGMGEAIVAGGAESMSMVSMSGNYFSPNPDLVEMNPEVYMPMGLTAEQVALEYKVSRAEQDEFAYRSHSRAAAAISAGHFKDEIAPVPVKITEMGPNNTPVTK